MNPNKRFKCPFCNEHNTKEKLIYHIEKHHEEMIPEGFTAAQVLFHSIHKRPYNVKGSCVICKGETKWNERTYKYNRLCDRRECKDKLRDSYKKNMLKVYGTYNILNDMDQQEKMLRNRSISGIYKFRNGKIKQFTGTYEKKFLEFCDIMLNMDPDDIMMPGPTIEYSYHGEKHVWITDVLILPYNLVLDIKDGGNNPNNREMSSYREKQIEKEKVITNKGEYNYLRLTDNQFGQLIGIMYELKLQMIEDPENTNTISRVHEDSLIFNDDISIIESYNEKQCYHKPRKVESNGTYKDALNVYKKLTKEDKKFFGFGTSGESINTIYRYFHYIDNEPVGFVDLSMTCKGEKVLEPLKDGVWIGIVVDPEHRGQGISKLLLNKAIQWFNGQSEFNVLCYSVDRDNKASVGLIKSRPDFKIYEPTKNYTRDTYYKTKNGVKIITESSQPLFISEKDVEYRVDDFKNRKVPILWITGQSGGGKTTTARKLADEMNCDLLEIDSVEHFLHLLAEKNNNNEIKKIINQDKNFKYIYDFAKNNKKLIEDCTINRNWNEAEWGKHFKKLFEWIYSVVKLIVPKYSTSNQLIVEGVQIPYIYFKDKSLFKNNAIMVKGTSTMISLFRRLKRDKPNANFGTMYSIFKMYKDWHKDIGEFRDKGPIK